MDFKLFLEAGNKAQLNIDPSIQPVPAIYAGSKVHKMASVDELRELALQGLRKYFTTVDPKGFSYAKERYKFLIKNAKSNADGLTLRIELYPIEKNPGEVEMSKEGDPMHGYNLKYNKGKTGYTVYKSPKQAVADIVPDSSLAYRGISWEEWQSIRKTGHISSRGMYNIGQEGYTLFGKEPNTALTYANGFAPIQYQVSFRKPGVIISIPRSLTITHQQDPENVPSSELGVKGKLSMDNIKDVWILVPRKVKDGSYIELIFPYIPAWDHNKYKDPMTGFYKLDPGHMRTGSGSTISTVDYSIMKFK